MKPLYPGGICAQAKMTGTGIPVKGDVHPLSLYNAIQLPLFSVPLVCGLGRYNTAHTRADGSNRYSNAHTYGRERLICQSNF